MAVSKQQGVFWSSASLLSIVPTILYWVFAVVATRGAEPAETALREIPDLAAVMLIFGLPALALALGGVAYMRRERLPRALTASFFGAVSLVLAAFGTLPFWL
jgi:hypothetical protein